ncbi:MAG TPA: hypothetical protein VL424_17835, partial [Pararobbsia sp.]|nr:hypothetical protein [Pararobbsia sp.]
MQAHDGTVQPAVPSTSRPNVPRGVPPFATLLLLLSHVSVPASHRANDGLSHDREKRSDHGMLEPSRSEALLDVGRRAVTQEHASVAPTHAGPIVETGLVEASSSAQRKACASIDPAIPVLEEFGRILGLRGARPDLFTEHMSFDFVRRLVARVSWGDPPLSSCVSPSITRGIGTVLDRQSVSPAQIPTPASERRVLAGVLELALFGQLDGQAWQFARDVLCDAARRSLGLAETQRLVAQRIADRFDTDADFS